MKRKGELSPGSAICLTVLFACSVAGFVGWIIWHMLSHMFDNWAVSAI